MLVVITRTMAKTLFVVGDNTNNGETNVGGQATNNGNGAN